MSQKILYILSGLSVTGGIEKYNQNLVRAAVAAGYSVDIVSRNDKENTFDTMQIHSCGRVGNMIMRKTLFLLKSLWRAFTFGPDLIVCGHVNFSPLCYLISLLYKKKYIVLTHGIDVWSLSGCAKKKAMQKAHLITTVSQFTKRKILEKLPGTKNKVQILPNAVNSVVFSPGDRPDYLMKRHNIEKLNKVILTVARFNKTEVRKGHYNVLDVFSDVLTTIPEAVYILAGSGDDLENIREYIIEKKIEESVILTDYVPDHELPDYYNLSDVFVMPSKKEGFGIVFLEALACGKPVICGNRDGSVDAVLNGEAGILVDPDSNEEIKQAIAGILKLSDDTKLSIGGHLRERVIEEFGSKRFNERMEECLRAL